MARSLDVAYWLRRLGLEKYAPAFRNNAIDAELPLRLTAEDLKDLGVTLVCHRRRLLDAIAALKSEASSTADPDASAESTSTLASAAAARSTDAERRQLTAMFCDLVARHPAAAVRPHVA